MENWKQELARDLLALGSIPFYSIVTVRAIIGQHQPFVFFVVLSFFILVILQVFLKRIDTYVIRSFLLFTSTSFFYQAPLYTLFAFLLWIGMLLSSYFLNKKHMIQSVVLGIFIALCSGYVTQEVYFQNIDIFDVMKGLFLFG